MSTILKFCGVSPVRVALIEILAARRARNTFPALLATAVDDDPRVRTAAMNVVGSGAINLRTNEIQLHFKTAKRKGFGINLLGIADKFIYIGGTLREPTVAVDPGRLLIEGGAAWASGGLTLLAEQLVTRLTASSDPCARVIRRGMRRGQ